VSRKTLIMTTTNGTGTLLATSGAEEVFLAAAANLSVAGAKARELLAGGRDVLILCAGNEGRFSLEDAYAAGRLVVEALGENRSRNGLNDAAVAAVDLVRRYGRHWRRPLRLSGAGRYLATLGMQLDVAEAAKQDRYPILPRFHDRRIGTA